jgi:hypothetical protein
MRVAAVLISALLAVRTAAAQPPEAPPPDDTRTKIIAAASVGAIHLGYATWSYFAWYRDAPSGSFKLEDERLGGLSFREYSGGADKFGHFWSNYVLTRGTTAALVAGGFPRLQSSLVSAGLTTIAFQLTEIQDGYYPYGYSWRDSVANILGVSLALVMENVPAVDRLLDFKLQYFPSADYRYYFRHEGSVDVGQDYTGQSYLLSLHLGALPHATDSEYMWWSRFIDLSFGFEAHHYSPEPVVDLAPHRQTLFVGLTLNMQGVLNSLLPDSLGRRIGNGIFEVYALPYTTLRMYDYSRTPR